MEEQTSRMKIFKAGDVTIVELTDRKILDEMSISQIGKALSDIIAESDAVRLVLDFASVDHMSSSALSMLITLNKRVRQSNGKLVLCNISLPIYKAFTITRLDEVFKTCADRSEAVAKASS